MLVQASTVPSWTELTSSLAFEDSCIWIRQLQPLESLELHQTAPMHAFDSNYDDGARKPRTTCMTKSQDDTTHIHLFFVVVEKAT